jgi:hypothetical protein
MYVSHAENAALQIHVGHGLMKEENGAPVLNITGRLVIFVADSLLLLYPVQRNSEWRVKRAWHSSLNSQCDWKKGMQIAGSVCLMSDSMQRREI